MADTDTTNRANGYATGEGEGSPAIMRASGGGTESRNGKASTDISSEHHNRHNRSRKLHHTDELCTRKARSA